MKILARTALIASLAWLAAVLFWEARASSAQGGGAEKMILLFGVVVLLGALIGIVLALSLLPALGGWIGNFFFSPGGRFPAREPHADAAAKLARGDFPGAVADLRAAFARDPADTFALAEAARILCEKLADPAAAAALLENALDRDWPLDQSAFLANRLADVYWLFQADAPRALAVLSQIRAAMPGTKHAAHAEARLREIAASREAC